MKLLLDSHTVLWSLASPEYLGIEGNKLLNDSNNNLWVSNASLIEMTIKINLGKLTYKGGIAELFNAIDAAGFRLLNIERNHLLEYGKLSLQHRGSF